MHKLANVWNLEEFSIGIVITMKRNVYALKQRKGTSRRRKAGLQNV